ncbi:Methyltransferase domain protein [uncultured delta proteobacterium]|uniref:Methyltransferase domain protein n=1 Tax=uncultured delta proteobacterium TaxID=34034 RepID=A0A212J123_9DELT|nr:Methyltransferase domain protein [uncultured delta proteobacterium]
MSTATTYEHDAPEMAERDNYTATYSPQDNKLRLYSASRLDPDTYAQAKRLGFKYAPKQGFFVAPMWTPAREDWLLKLAGCIEDEDSTTEERAAERAARFEGYSEKRGTEAERAVSAVRSITEHIPFGQPILVGHHSERRARKDAERIENGMRKAVNLWETSEYWQRRARASLAHARYAERPDVRYRRIKKLEASKRKHERSRDGQQKALKLWSQPDITYEKALAIADSESLFGIYTSFEFPLARYPRDHTPYEGSRSVWSALESGIIDEKKAVALMVPRLERGIAWDNRWIAHYENRVAYERAMLGEDTGTEAKGAAILPFQQMDMQPGGTVQISRSHSRGELLSILRVNKKNGIINSLTVVSRWGRYAVAIEEVTEYTPPTEESAAAVKKATVQPPIVNIPGEGYKHMTKAQWAKIHKDYKGTEKVRANDEHGAYRYRKAMWSEDGRTCYGPVFLSDQKEIPLPPPSAEKTDLSALMPRAAASPAPVPAPAASETDTPPAADDYEAPGMAEEIKNLKGQLKEGVQIAVADQLFPTPAHIVEQMIDYADIQPDSRILEPSAGTGAILDGLAQHGVDLHNVEAVELNYTLAAALREKYPYVSQGDFLQYGTSAAAGFDRILMNPPFKNGIDIKHIEHAYSLLNPGGVLVAICANGPRQQDRLRPMAEESGGGYEVLPPNTFDGTGVNTAMVHIYK